MADAERRGQEEDVWSKALLEVPEYWLGYLGRLQNTQRIRQILSNQDQKMLFDRFGISLSADTNETIKEKLLAIKRKIPDAEKEIGQNWPAETVSQLENITSQRNQRKYSS